MPLSDGKTPAWQKVALFVILTAVLCIVVFIAVSSVGTNSAVNATRDSVERTDCARSINAEQASVRDAATIADRAARRFLDRVLLDTAVNGTQATPEVREQRVETYGQLVEAAEAADKAVSELPDPAQEVDRRCPG